MHVAIVLECAGVCATSLKQWLLEAEGYFLCNVDWAGSKAWDDMIVMISTVTSTAAQHH